MTDTELNELRYKYFKMIIHAWTTGDAEPLYPYIADDCTWGGKQGREDVIADFKTINVNYKHVSTLVRLGPKPDPLACTDESGKPVRVSLLYEAGEICMFDVTEHNTLLFRLKLNEDGKIRSFYGTFPFFFTFHEIEQ